MAFHFARRMEKIEMSGIRRIFDLVAQMPSAVDLSLGQPNFDVPEATKEAAIRAIRAGHSRYTVTQGIPALREKLRHHLDRKYGVKPEEIMITSGVAGGLFLAMLVLVDPGDEVLVSDPCFALYKHLVTLCRGVPVYVDTYPDFRLTPERIDRAATPNTRYMILNYPANPTGVTYTKEEVAALAACARRRGLFVISDEIYDGFTYDFAHEPFARHGDAVLGLGGFSKTYGMPGWRLGYAYGPREIVEKMNMLQQFSFVCAPSFAQHAGVQALDEDMSETIDAYRRKRDRVYEGLQGAYEVVRPQGAFYAFPKAPSGTDEEFVKRAIAANLLVVPGGAFSPRRTHFRVSFAAKDEDLDRGIEILRRLAGK